MGVNIYTSGIWKEIGYNATKLAIPVNINDVSFDGSANITIYDSTKLPLSGGTLTGKLTATSIVTSLGLEPNEALSNNIGNTIKPYDSIYGNELYLLSAISTNKIILTASDTIPNIRPAINDVGTLGTPSNVWNNIYATTITGNLDGDISGSSGSCIGNSATATKAMQDGSGNIITVHYSPINHIHGNITNVGAIGTTTDLMVKTTTDGVLTTLAAGTTGQYLKHDGSWATPPNDNTVYTHPEDVATAGTYRSVTVANTGHVTSGTNPTTLSGYGITDASSSTHVHGNITNAGAIGTAEDLIVKTTTSGVLTTLAKGTTGQYLTYNGSWATPPNDNTVYTHPNYDARSIAIDTDGVDVLDTLNITTDVYGHITVGNGAKRTLPSASTSATGVLTSTDWTTFNDKINSLASVTQGYIPAWGANGKTLSTGYSVETTMTGSTTALVRADAVKTYIDNLLSTADALIYKGIISCASNPDFPAGDKGHVYKISVGGKIGGASGTIVEAGDMIICNTDSTIAGTLAAVGTKWDIIQTNIDIEGLQPKDADLTAIAGLSTTGIAVRTAADTWATRKLIAGTGITITNDTGVSGDITITHSDPSTQVTVTNTGRTYIQSINLDDMGHVTALSSATETIVNTDINVTQTATNTNSTYPILLTNTVDKTTTSTDTARFASAVKVNPSTGILTATGFSGPLIGNVTGNVTGTATPLSHTHGNISNLGAIGTTAGLMVLTTTAGVLTTLSAGSAGQYLSYDGSWNTPPNTPNTDTLVTQTATSTNSTYPILLTNTVDKTATSTDTARFASAVNVNPSTGVLTATGFSGNLTGNVTGTATPLSHVHGNITNLGAIGTTKGLIAITTTSGVLTTLAAGDNSQYLRGDGVWNTIISTDTQVTQTATTSNYTYPLLFTNTVDKSTTDTDTARFASTVKVNPSTGVLTATGFSGNLTGNVTGTATPLSHIHGNITNAGAIGTTKDLIVKTTTSGVLTTLTPGTTSQFLRGDGVWSNPATANVFDVTNVYTATAGQTAFNIASIWTDAGNVVTVFIDGLHALENIDYTKNSTTKEITLINSAEVGELILVKVSAVSPVNITLPDAYLNSPTFTGTPNAPTATAGNNSTRIATTAFVQGALSSVSSLDSPAITGIPTAPTADIGNNTTQLATTAFVANALNSISALYTMTTGQTLIDISSIWTNNNSKITVHLNGLYIPENGGYTKDNLTKKITLTKASIAGEVVSVTVSNIAFNNDLTSLFVSSVSPILTGTPTTPTANIGTNTTQIANTKFVNDAIKNIAGVSGVYELTTGDSVIDISDIWINDDVALTVHLNGLHIPETISYTKNITTKKITLLNAVGYNSTVFVTVSSVMYDNDLTSVFISKNNPVVATQIVGDNSNKIANTEFVNSAIDDMFKFMIALT